MKTVKYNAAILERFAARLEGQATRVEAGWTIGLMAVGFAVAAGFSRAGYEFGSTACITVAAGLVIGFLIGQSRALTIRVQLHTMLCNVEQEKHLRRIAERE